MAQNTSGLKEMGGNETWRTTFVKLVVHFFPSSLLFTPSCLGVNHTEATRREYRGQSLIRMKCGSFGEAMVRHWLPLY